MLVYFADLAEFDVRDVANACTYLRQTTGPFVPSIAALRGQVATERDVRVANDRLPDFTRFDQLPAGEQTRRLEAGLRGSIEREAREESEADDWTEHPRLAELNEANEETRR